MCIYSLEYKYGFIILYNIPTYVHLHHITRNQLGINYNINWCTFIQIKIRFKFNKQNKHYINMYGVYLYKLKY